MSDMIRDYQVGAANTVTRADSEKVAKSLHGQIKRAAEKALGIKPLSATDGKLGRDRAFFRAEVERLTGICNAAREAIASEAIKLATVKDAPTVATTAPGGDAE